MLRTLSLVMFLGLAACSGGSKSADEPGGGDGTGTGDTGPDPKSATPCCCELYDLETPNITYSTLPESDCAAQEGRCEETDEYCEAP